MYFGGVELNGHVWTKRRWGRGNRSACLWVWIFECSMWWVVARHDETRVRKRGKGEGWAGASRGSQCIRLNGCQVGGVMCGRGGGTSLHWRQMLHWLDFIFHRQTQRSMPTLRSVCVVFCVNITHSIKVARARSDRNQIFLRLYLVLFVASAARLTPHCSKEKKSCDREKGRERDVRYEGRAAWHLAQCCIIGCGWCDLKRLQKYNTHTNHLPALSILQLSLS